MGLAIAAVWLLCAASAAFTAHAKGRPVAEGIALGVLLSAAGLLIELVLPSRRDGTPPIWDGAAKQRSADRLSYLAAEADRKRRQSRQAQD